MGEKNRDGSTHTIIEAEPSGRFELACCGGAVLLAGHARMNARHNGHNDKENEQSVHGADERTAPPRDGVPGFESEHVQQRESPSIEDVGEEAVDFGAVAIGGEDGTYHEWEVNAG